MHKVVERGTKSLINSRIKRKSFLNKIVHNVDDLIPHFQNGMYIGWSGFAGTSYPKVVPIALADHVEKNNLQGKLKMNLFVGASTGPETEDRWAMLDMIDKRYPHQNGHHIRNGINQGRIRFSDEHLAIFANELIGGYYTMDKPHGSKRTLDVAIIEATEITEDGCIVPGASVEDEVSNAIANHIVGFFKNEIEQGRLPKNLLPLQSGIGSIANAVVGGLSRGPFDNISVWTEVVQDTFLDFFDNGKLKFASATSLRFSPAGFNRLFNNWETYQNKLVLRNQSISNSAELVRRLGVIAMNTPVEFDIYGHVNSTCTFGSKMLNGLGGSGEFLRNSKLSIVHAPSTRPTKSDPHGISSVIPFASHIDHPEHDIDILVTEQGLADIRGLAPYERAKVIIEKCAHPIYKPILMEYLETSHSLGIKKGMGHEPHQLDKAFKFYTNLFEKGTMRIDKW
ncbi:acetyl-coa hydrolase [Dictyostelium purpureum]|uniref:Acetyl-CoA hydrolase n=1 Tax=Dictyostelium purpureum TaxID=5786 RepID=F0ZCH8_DICPU|nr:acetyl-coa hydrolase [Dictyostelium purpureum]EGC38349.1 acetyl-coa hydrolase [Dictyostelium purpureum]|eukprot:XP_003285106.1 acetyl-coa hydrolase [Dictyostelium purpureum]